MSIRKTIWVSSDRSGEHIYYDLQRGDNDNSSIVISAKRDVLDLIYLDDKEIEIEIKLGSHLYRLLKEIK